MSKKILLDKDISLKTLKFVVDAGHTSVLEHVQIVFALESVSRSFLAQITRHRMGSFTSASQHYADYRDMPTVVHPDYVDEFTEQVYQTDDPDLVIGLSALEVAMVDYVQMIKNGVPAEEARQILPNAAAVNIIWTVNARSLLNFFEQRLCKRNVAEMQIVAQKIWAEVYNYWPEFAELCGPYCYPTGECNQRKMGCGEPYERV